MLCPVILVPFLFVENFQPLDDYLTKGRAILFEGEDDGGFLPFICWPPRNSSQRRRQAVIIGEIAPTQNNIWIDNSIRTSVSRNLISTYEQSSGISPFGDTQ